MKQKKNLWVNLLFAAVVLVIAGVLFYLRSAGQSGSTLGAELTYQNDTVLVHPGRLPGCCRLPCGESGSTLRLLLPVVAALGIHAGFFMEGRLPSRPLAPLGRELEAGG